MALAGVAAAEVTIDLTPAEISTGIAAAGINPSNVWGYNEMEWHGTWEYESLDGQVRIADSCLLLSIGAVASQYTGGNFAAVKFTTDDTPITLSFNMVENPSGSSWGGNLSSFAAEYSCEVYGFGSDGVSTLIGSWKKSMTGPEVAASTTISEDVTIELASGDYTAYGIIFHSMDTTTVGKAAGMSMYISDIVVTTIPEPTTATLSLLALAGLAARRRRK